MREREIDEGMEKRDTKKMGRGKSRQKREGGRDGKNREIDIDRGKEKRETKGKRERYRKKKEIKRERGKGKIEKSEIEGRQKTKGGCEK